MNRYGQLRVSIVRFEDQELHYFVGCVDEAKIVMATLLLTLQYESSLEMFNGDYWEEYLLNGKRIDYSEEMNRLDGTSTQIS